MCGILVVTLAIWGTMFWRDRSDFRRSLNLEVVMIFRLETKSKEK